MSGQSASNPPGAPQVCHCEACRTRKPLDPAVENLRDTLGNEWRERMMSVETSSGVQPFKSNALPLTRVHKLMKADRDVKMIGLDAACLLTKASEFFVEELTRLSWLRTEANKRKTLMNVDTEKVIGQMETFDFLVDVINGTIQMERQRARDLMNAELKESGSDVDVRTATIKMETQDESGVCVQPKEARPVSASTKTELSKSAN